MKVTLMRFSPRSKMQNEAETSLGWRHQRKSLRDTPSGIHYKWRIRDRPGFGQQSRTPTVKNRNFLIPNVRPIRNRWIFIICKKSKAILFRRSNASLTSLSFAKCSIETHNGFQSRRGRRKCADFRGISVAQLQTTRIQWNISFRAASTKSNGE